MPARKKPANTKPPKKSEERSPDRSLPYSCYRTLMRGTQQDDFKMSEYINFVSGVSRLEDDAGRLDHTYAKSSGWLPQNYFMRPCRYLYSTAVLDRKKSTATVDSDLDTDGVDEAPLAVALAGQGQTIAEQCDSDLEDKQDDDDSCWEEDVSKVGWSPVQIRIVPKVVQLLEDVRLARLALKGRPNEIILVDNAFNSFSSKLSHHLASVGWDRQITQWLHALLMKYLSPRRKTDYTILLALVRKKLPAFVDRMLVPVHVGRGSFGKDGDRFPTTTLPTCTDRVAEILLRETFKNLPHGPVFVMIPNSLGAENGERFQLITRQMQQMGEVYVVGFPPPTNVLMKQYLDQLMMKVRTRLVEISSDYPGRPIVLVGWTLGAALACLAAQVEPTGVQAVVCLGFPTKTVDGSGDLNSSTLNVPCPILFVLGSRSKLSGREDVEDARAAMKVPNHLVLMGSCNDHLVMGRRELDLFGVTQTMVDRSLLGEIYNFVGEVLTRPPPSPPHTVRRPPKDTFVVRRPISQVRKTSLTKTNNMILKKQFKMPATKLPKTVVGGNGKIHVTSTPSIVSLPKKSRMSHVPNFVSNPENSAKYTVLLTHNYAANL